MKLLAYLLHSYCLETRFSLTVESFFLIFPRREWRRRSIALSDWADKMFEAQRVLLDTAQRLQQQKDARHMEVSRGVITRFDVGSYVLISYNPQKMNAKPPTKLHPSLKGPYLVANVGQGDKYSCQNFVTEEIDRRLSCHKTKRISLR